MAKANIYKVLVFVGCAILAGAFYFFDMRHGWSGRTLDKPSVQGASAPANIIGNKKADELTATVKDVKGALPPYTGESAHVLRGDPVFTASLPKDFADKYKKILEDTAVKLDANQKDYDGWISVAYIKKLFKDYNGARDALEYAKVVFPAYPLAYFNLATLYGFYLHEPAKAELDYRAAIQKDSTDANQYMGLADFYVMVAKEPQKAEAVILEGITNLPQDTNLVIYLASFYRDHGNKEKAAMWYKKALALGLPSDQKDAVEKELANIGQ